MVNDPELLTMTATMRSLWLRELLDPGSNVNHIGFTARVRGPVTAAELADRAMRALDRHELLRSVVDPDHHPEPRMVIADVVPAVDVVDATAWDEDEIDAYRTALLFEPYDLTVGPLIRFGILDRGDELVLVVGAHHLVADLWSFSLLGRELVSSDGHELRRPGSFARHVARERAYLAGGSDDDLAHWVRTLDGVEPTIDLPFLRTAGVDRRAASVPVDCPPELARAVAALATRLGVAPASIVLAAFLIVTARTVGRDDLLLGSTRANRSVSNGDVVGCLMNPVAIRAGVDPDEPCRELLLRTDRAFADAMRHGRHPVASLFAAVASDARQHGPNVGFLWQKTTRAFDPTLMTAAATGVPGATVVHRGLTIEIDPRPARSAPYDLALVGAAGPDGTLSLGLEFPAAMVDATDARRVAGHVATVLTAIVAAPDAAVGHLEMLTAAELDDVHRTWSGRRQEPVGETVHGWILRELARAPQRIAVVDADGELTAAELTVRIEQIRQVLVDEGVRPGDLVGVMTTRGAGMLAATIATMAAGAAYVPIDPSFPADRIRYMLDDARARVVAIDASTASTVPESVVAVRIDAPVPPGIDGGREVPFEDPVHAADAAYVMYTSGSTGAPKGVVVEHRNVTNFLRSMQREPGLAPSDTLLALTTLSFDISVLELFLPLVAGARVVIADRATAVDAGAVAAAIDAHGITVVQATPTTWRMLVEHGWQGEVGLTALSGGEPLPPDLADQLRERVAHLWNLYGPTETTVWSTAHHVTDDRRPVSIGRPIDNTTVYVLDRHGRPAPVGVPGELHIGGDGVARGYLRRPELDAERFVPDPFGGGRMYRTGDLVRRRPDGRLEHLGRLDHQIKLRGHRIELEEVEHAVARHPDVASAVVAVHEPTPGDARLVAYVVPRSGRPVPDSAAVRTVVDPLLPAYMVPTVVVGLERLPLTPNGKIDRGALPRPGHVAARPGAERPRPGLEQTIAAIWSEVLGVDVVDRHDDFAALGGHSLLATRVASLLRRETQRSVTVATVFEHPTIATAAAAIAHLPLRATPTISLVGGERTGPLTHSQERMWFVHQLDPDGAAYNIVVGLRLRGVLRVDAMEASLASVVRRHESLRTTFELVDGTPVQRVHPVGAIAIDVVDHTHASRERGDAELEAALTTFARRPFRLDRLPLVRAELHRIGADDHVLAISMHHIISDQWSLGVLSDELAAAYRAHTDRAVAAAFAPAAAEHAAVQQVDYARWHRALVEERLVPEQLAYWRQQLAGVRPTTLAPDRPRPPVRTSAGALVIGRLSSDVRTALDAHCRAHGVSPFMVLLAAFDVLLARVCDTDDVAIGTAVANRNWLEGEHLVSSLVNTVIVRTPVTLDAGFDVAVRRARHAALGAFEHQDLPFAKLVEELRAERRRDRSPLVDIFFNVTNAPVGPPDLGEIEVEVVPIDRRAAQFDLALTVDTAVTGDVAIEYSTDLYEEDRVRDLLADYLSLLERVLAEPSRPVGEWEITSAPVTMAPAPSASTVVAQEPPRPGTEQAVAAAWRRVLAVDEVHRDDDFFQVGGHSLLAVRLLVEIERQLGRQLPISALFSAPTIAGLAALVDTDGPLTRWTSLVPLQPGGERPPLFYVAPFLITSLSFTHLADALGEDQPFYVLQPQGMDTDDPVHDSVPAMAAHYLAELRQVAPRGPYRIGGHCAGATVAYEMVCRLREAGEVVDSFVIVDADPPHVGRQRRIGPVHAVRRLRHYVADGRLHDAVRWRLWVAYERSVLGRIGGGRARRLADLRARHARAHAVHRPEPVDVPAVLIRSTEWADDPANDAQLRWGELARGGVQELRIPSTHAGLLDAQAARHLAAALTAAVDGSAPSPPTDADPGDRDPGDRRVTR